MLLQLLYCTSPDISTRSCCCRRRTMYGICFGSSGGVGCCCDQSLGGSTAAAAAAALPSSGSATACLSVRLSVAPVPLLFFAERRCPIARSFFLSLASVLAPLSLFLPCHCEQQRRLNLAVPKISELCVCFAEPYSSSVSPTPPLLLIPFFHPPPL